MCSTYMQVSVSHSFPTPKFSIIHSLSSPRCPHWSPLLWTSPWSGMIQFCPLLKEEVSYPSWPPTPLSLAHSTLSTLIFLMVLEHPKLLLACGLCTCYLCREHSSPRYTCDYYLASLMSWLKYHSSRTPSMI